MTITSAQLSGRACAFFRAKVMGMESVVAKIVLPSRILRGF
jgi:hypothetical protein